MRHSAKLFGLMEDESLAELMDEVEEDEWYERDSGQQVYHWMLRQKACLNVNQRLRPSGIGYDQSRME
jgi:hypothetical protein